MLQPILAWPGQQEVHCKRSATTCYNTTNHLLILRRSFAWDKTSKAGSIKGNFSGVSTEMRRNHKAIEKLKDEFDEEKWQAREQGNG